MTLSTYFRKVNFWLYLFEGRNLFGWPIGMVDGLIQNHDMHTRSLDEFSRSLQLLLCFLDRTYLRISFL